MAKEDEISAVKRIVERGPHAFTQPEDIEDLRLVLARLEGAAPSCGECEYDPDLLYHDHTPARRLANEMARHIIGENDPTGAEEACQRCVHIAERALTATEDGARRAERARLDRMRERYHAALEEGMLVERAGRLAEGIEGAFDQALKDVRALATEAPPGQGGTTDD